MEHMEQFEAHCAEASRDLGAAGDRVADTLVLAMQNDEIIYDVADFYKVFGDSTRIKILYALLRQEMCVGDLADSLDMTQSAVSHQLRVLRQNDLVKFRKDGKSVYYSLDDTHIAILLQQGLQHILHKKVYGFE